MRADITRLERSIEAARTRAAASANAGRSRINRLLILTVVASLLAVLVLAGLTRRWVLSPLERVRSAVSRVARGALEVQVPAPGPVELARLGHDVEQMRLRLRREAHEARAVNDQLELVNRDLEAEVAERRRVEEALRER